MRSRERPGNGFRATLKRCLLGGACHKRTPKQTTKTFGGGTIIPHVMFDKALRPLGLAELGGELGVLGLGEQLLELGLFAAPHGGPGL